MSETQLFTSFHGRKYLAVQGKHGDGKILFHVLSGLQPQTTSL